VIRQGKRLLSSSKPCTPAVGPPQPSVFRLTTYRHLPVTPSVRAQGLHLFISIKSVVVVKVLGSSPVLFFGMIVKFASCLVFLGDGPAYTCRFAVVQVAAGDCYMRGRL
jgi:hypothetical protein